ncbi:MAG TPA: sigma-70 family RNA polymerase sigma factor [Microthrixaceae bacterium]|nr:sigma-70 family RNA polymerase sigma factor [Microthrixaceae bacterium]
MSERLKFTAFVEDVEPRLHRSLTALWGVDAGRDATAEALAWAWENWPSVESMENPAGYLYRVGASKVRTRRKPLENFNELLNHGDHVGQPDPGGRHFEPGLLVALERLSERQRTVVLLIHGCGWTHQEVADALELSRSSVGTHLDRAMVALRSDLGVE